MVRTEYYLLPAITGIFSCKWYPFEKSPRRLIYTIFLSTVIKKMIFFLYSFNSLSNFIQPFRKDHTH